MHDPYNHLFVDQSEVSLIQHVYRMVHTVRRESLDAVLPANGGDEGTAIGYACVARTDAQAPYRIWYMCHADGRVRLAESADGHEWVRKGAALANPDLYRIDNIAVTPVGSRADSWWQGSQWAGYVYGTATTGEDHSEHGLFLTRSIDGEHLEVRHPGILSGVGDRSSLYFDEVSERYSLISRPSGRTPGFQPRELERPRVANLWTSSDLVDWQNQGVVLAYDERDDYDVEIYGMQPFRHGSCLLAWVEIYHRGRERLDTQLAYSADGLRWHRAEPRMPSLPMGAEGTWDSHWAVPTNNPPFVNGDRMVLFYSGAGTKHGSKRRHKRGIGMASLRLDGFVSMESGRRPGIVVTTPQPLEQPMQLEVNANCYSGYVKVDVLSTEDGLQNTPREGYSSEDGVLEQVDGVRLMVRWGDKAVVQPVEGGRCYLRFTMEQASLFAYRWAPAS